MLTRSLRFESVALPYTIVAATWQSRAIDKQIVDAVREQFGRLDVLVNNAGVPATPRADILDATEESFDRVIGINLKGPYFLTQLVARWMIEQRQADEAFAA